MRINCKSINCKRINRNRIFIMLGFLAFLGLVIGNIVNYTHFLDSDMSTNLLLAKLCSDENKMMTQSWQYGNESRFINNQLIYALVFKFTDNWKAVRVVGNCILYTLLLLAAGFMLKQMEVRREIQILTPAVMLIPFSMIDLIIVFLSTDYLTAIALTFLFLGLYLRWRKLTQEIPFWKKCIHIGLIWLLCLVMGLCGIRLGMLWAAPWALLLIVLLWTERKEYAVSKEKILVNLGAIAFFGVGYLYTSTVLQKKYGFETFSNLVFLNWKNNTLAANIEETVGTFLFAMGYEDGAAVFSLKGIINLSVLLVVIVLGIIICRLLRSDQLSSGSRMIVWFGLLAVLVSLGVFILTDDRMVVHRYFIPCIFMLYPVCAIYFEEETSKRKKMMIGLALACYVMLGGMRTYASWTLNSLNENKMAVTEYLKAEGLNFGYATHWNAGIITELTSGEIEIANLYDVENGKPLMTLAPKRYYEKGYHEGTVFLLLGVSEYGELKDTEVVARGEITYQDENFYVLLYDSKDDVCSYTLP